MPVQPNRFALWVTTALLACLALAGCSGGGSGGATGGEAEAPSAGEARSTFRLERGGANQFLLPVEIGNQTFRLLVDTGSNALLVFADKVAPGNTGIVATATPVSKGYSSTVRSGRLAHAAVKIGGYSAERMAIMLIDSPASGSDPSLAAKGADGVIGLRRTEGLTLRMDSVPLDPPLAALLPAVGTFELDLPTSGEASLTFGRMPTVERANPDFVFRAKTLSITDTVDRVSRSYSDLQVPFRARSRLGEAASADLDILLDTGAVSHLVLDTEVAASLGYNKATRSWSLAPDDEVELHLIGPGSTVGINPRFKVSEIKVAPYRTMGVEFEAVLGISRWQNYVVGFSYVDYQGGGPDGTISLLDRRVQQAALAYDVPAGGSRYVALPGLNSAGDDRYPAADHDGRTVVFQSNRAGGLGGWDVYAYRAGEGILTLPGLNSAADDGDPTVSADGRFVAFHSGRPGGAGGFDLYLYDLETRALVDLPGLNTPSLERNPALSPDGRFLAFRSERPGGAGLSDLYVYDRQRQSLVDLPGVNTAWHQTDPSLSHGGRFLAFDGRRLTDTKDKDIFLYDVDRKQLIPFAAATHTSPLSGVNTFHEEQAPAVSPDGAWVAFHTNRNDPVMGLYDRDLAIVEVATGQVVHAPGLNTPFDESAPSFSGDGRLVAFHSQRPGGQGGSDVYLYRFSAAEALPVGRHDDLPQEQMPLVRTPDGRFTVTATVDGRPVRLLLDTTLTALVLFEDRLPAGALPQGGPEVGLRVWGADVPSLLWGRSQTVSLALGERQATGLAAVVTG
ncbi:MAG: hypothetical protein ACYDA8_12360, partial [Deferrisomatales bacterium]